MDEEVTLLVSKSSTPAPDPVPIVFHLLGTKAPKEKYDDYYELLVDLHNAFVNSPNGIPLQSVAYGRVRSMVTKKEVLRKVLDRKEYHLLKYIYISKLFDEEIIDTYGEELLRYVLDTGNDIFGVEYNQLFLKKCIKLIKTDKNFVKLLFLYNPYYFKDEIKKELYEDYEIIIEYGIENDFIQIKKFFPELLTDRDIYISYIDKAKSDDKYLLYLIESPLIDEYYIELKDIIIKGIKDGKISLPSYLRQNVDFFKDCMHSFDIFDGNFKLFSKVRLIEGIVLDKFTPEEIADVIKYCGINETVENLVRKVKYLYKVNDEFIGTITINMLDSKYNFISLESLEKIVVDPDLQGIIVFLSDDKLRLLDKLLEHMNRKDIDLSNLLYTVLSKLNDSDTKNQEFIELLEKINIDSLSPEQLDCLILVLTKETNMFNVNSAEDLKEENFQNLRKAYFEKIDKKIEDGTIEIEELRRAVLEKTYGLDYSAADFIYKRYCTYLNGYKIDNEEIKDLLTSISSIMREKSIDVLIELYKIAKYAITNYYSAVALESCIRKAYAKSVADSLFRVGDHPEQLTKREATYEGEEVLVYDLHGDFRMQIHALGAYTRSEWTRPIDFLDDWDRPKIASHGLCTSYIGNCQIATARPNGPILGFSNYEESALLVAGNYDLVSKRVNSKFSVSMHIPYLFVPPKSMLDFTRHNHNEIVLERRNNSGKGGFKRKPDYIVYIVDDSSDLSNFSSDNAYYQQTLQAARDFGVPVIVIDRLAYARAELRKALEGEKAFYETGDTSILSEIFMIYANNEVGCRMFPEYDSNGQEIQQEPKEYQKIFNKDVIKEFVNRVIDNTLTANFTDEQKITIFKRLYVLLRNETTKFKKLKASIRIDYTAEIDRVNTELLKLGSEGFTHGK